MCKLKFTTSRTSCFDFWVIPQTWKSRSMILEWCARHRLVAEDSAEADVLKKSVLAVIAVSACMQDRAFRMTGLCCLQAMWKLRGSESMNQEQCLELITSWIVPFSAFCSQLITQHCCIHMVLLILSLPLLLVVLFCKTPIVLKIFCEKLYLIQSGRLEKNIACKFWNRPRRRQRAYSAKFHVPWPNVYSNELATPYFPSVRNILFIPLSTASSSDSFH